MPDAAIPSPFKAAGQDRQREINFIHGNEIELSFFWKDCLCRSFARSNE